MCRYCCEWAYNVLSPNAHKYVLYMHAHAHTPHLRTRVHTCMHTIHMCVCTYTHSSTLQACYKETLGEKSSWSEMCMLYNAYCAKLSNIGAMSSTEFLTVLRWTLPRTHWAVAWSYCTGRLVFYLDLS